jgi:hypothetical protein
MSDKNGKKLLEDAHAQGALSASALKALDIPDLGAQIQAGLGVDVDDVASSEVVLVTMMPDDSGSISSAGNTDVVCDGHNLVLGALRASKQSADVFVHTRYLNGEVLYPYAPLDGAVTMDRSNFRADKGTPLYDQTAVVLATVLAKSQEFAQAGVPVRTVTLIITDGADAGSSRHTATSIRTIVRDMLAQENHVVAAMGISDGGTDFHQVFRDMGIPDRWILTPGNSASEVRKAFQVFSQSAIAASQGAALATLGGFSN